mmetsp:Transcript_83043/g.131018  ORF Transcript_83043/g.131018 Transcript_83043/m.131018 type:complete len:666 (+) Transcript_83043:81-2078(+)
MRFGLEDKLWRDDGQRLCERKAVFIASLSTFMQGVGEAMQATTILAADVLQHVWQLLALLLHAITLRFALVGCRGQVMKSGVEIYTPTDDTCIKDVCLADAFDASDAANGGAVGEQLEVSEHLHHDATELVTAHSDSTTSTEYPACSSDQAACVADLNIVESVKGLRGLKAALASHFMYNRSSLPNDFRCGYLVDMDEHWITVHVIFNKKPELSSLSLIVFDTLEIDYQRFHRVGLLRSSSAEGGPPHELPGPLAELQVDAEGIDVVTLCKMLGIHYDIAFLAPVCDMRRLTLEEEEHIRMEKKSSSKPSTVYYDRRGKPFKKIIVQPILQSEQDGTCKSRALAVLGWLLNLDERKLAWYVASHRELFYVELRAIRGNLAHDDEKGPLFGSLMSTGRRDKFGRDVHLKVCHADTLQYNQDVEASYATGMHDSLPASCDLDVGSGKQNEISLQHKRDKEIDQIRSILCQSGNAQRWRSIEDHEARWHFLEETCFFGHNIGYKKIKKAFPREDVLRSMPAIQDNEQSCPGDLDNVHSPSREDNSHGFGTTRYLRKYLLPGGYISHEADPMFNQPLENFFSFLCGDDQGDKITVPFYMLPFPESFMGLSLDTHALGANTVLALESDPEWHKTQKVSDYVLPSGNTFLNNPISYNKTSENISLPVKLFV